MDLDPNPGDPNHMDPTDPDLDPQHWLTVRFCKFIASMRKLSVIKKPFQFDYWSFTLAQK